MMDFLNNMMSSGGPKPTVTPTGAPGPGAGVTITEPAQPGMDFNKMGQALNQAGMKGLQAAQQVPTNPMQASQMSNALRAQPGGQMFDPNAMRR